MAQRSDSSQPTAWVPAGLLAACMPLEATPAGSVALGDGGAAAALVPSAATSRVGSLRGVQFCTLQQLQPQQEPAQPLDAADLLYELEWQAAMRTEAAVLAPAQSQLLPCWPQKQCAAALGLSQAASLAAADVVQMLQGSRASPLQALVLHSTGSVPAQPVLGSSQSAVSTAAIAGVLNCLPYELPSLPCQLLDGDPQAALAATSSERSSSGSRTYALSTSPLPMHLEADLYGVTVRAGTLHRPLLRYKLAPPPQGGNPSSGLETYGSAVQSSGTFAVTGGLGGLGLLTASWLVGRGALALVLVSRAGLAASSADASTVTRSAALVAMAKCDASASEDAALLARLAQTQAEPFGGIMHTAGVQVCALIALLVLSRQLAPCWLWNQLASFACPPQVEARLQMQTLRTLRQAMAPKLGAVQSCGEASAANPLAFLVLFSSVCSVAGFSGHANYAAANAALDAVAQWQATTGAPTVAVQWGAWASVGEQAVCACTSLLICSMHLDSGAI